MKVFKVITRDNPAALIEAEHYHEDGSFVNFFIKRKEHAVQVASFNKMSITSIVIIAERDIGTSYDGTAMYVYEYTGLDPSGNDAEKIKRLNRD